MKAEAWAIVDAAEIDLTSIRKSRLAVIVNFVSRRYPIMPRDDGTYDRDLWTDSLFEELWMLQRSRSATVERVVVSLIQEDAA